MVVMKNYLEAMGITELSAIFRNLTPAELTERALARGEGKLADNGADSDYKRCLFIGVAFISVFCEAVENQVFAVAGFNP